MNKFIKTLVVTACLTTTGLLAGCSSKSIGKSYYQLSSNIGNVLTQTMQTKKNFMWIESVEVADFLNKPGIVLQTRDINYVTANNHLWVSTLSQQLRDRLEQDLMRLLPNYLVSNQAIATPTLRVKLYIDAFYGSYTGDAVIKGRWVVGDSRDRLYTKAFERHVPLTRNGYDALVKALSRGWQDIEFDFANSIRQ